MHVRLAQKSVPFCILTHALSRSECCAWPGGSTVVGWQRRLVVIRISIHFLHRPSVNAPTQDTRHQNCNFVMCRIQIRPIRTFWWRVVPAARQSLKQRSVEPKSSLCGGRFAENLDHRIPRRNASRVGAWKLDA